MRRSFRRLGRVSIRTRVKRETSMPARSTATFSNFDPHPREAGDLLAAQTAWGKKWFRSAPA